MRRTNPSGVVRRITSVATQLAFRRNAVIASPDRPKRRRPYRAPTGLPKPRENWRLGTVASLLLHVLMLALLIWPFASGTAPVEIAQGAGGPGPAGGGGGGSRGTGAPETIKYVRIAPSEPPPAPQLKIAPPVIPPVKPPEPKPEPKAETAPPPEPANPAIPVGTGGGTGADGTAGTGPGTGGGVGTGVGTGRGSGAGPGTGGGNQANYPPTPIEMFIPPLPVPSSVKGFHLIAEFDVDSNGRVLGMTFTETRDRGYNRRLADALRGYRFRAGTTPDGTPVRMKAQIVMDLY